MTLRDAIEGLRRPHAQGCLVSCSDEGYECDCGADEHNARVEEVLRMVDAADGVTGARKDHG